MSQESQKSDLEVDTFLESLRSDQARADYSYLKANFCDTITEMVCYDREQLGEIVNELDPPVPSHKQDMYIDAIKDSLDAELDDRYAARVQGDFAMKVVKTAESG